MRRCNIKKQAPLTYYGGKRRMVNYIMPLIPRHSIYVEPYFGGGTIFFEKKPSYLEVINDINGQLINFYLQIQENFEELNEKIQNTLCSESLFKWAKEVYNGKISVPDVERALATWLVFNMAINSNPLANWSYNNGTGGSHTGILLAHKRDSFCPWLKERMRYVQISQRDALKVIKERDSEQTFFYLDPPYPNTNQGHYSGFTFDNLEELLIVLQNIKGKFILSNYPAEIITRYAQKKNWLLEDIVMKQDIVNAMGVKSTKTEILLYNYNPEKTSQLSLNF